MPVEKYQKEELQLLNGLYPNGKVQPGQYIKVVGVMRCDCLDFGARTM